jgi:hypothetical protein
MEGAPMDVGPRSSRGLQTRSVHVKRPAIGYSDDVSVFLNGNILYRGLSGQSFRDPEFLGIVSADNDAVYHPSKKGKNELALSERGGGWGFICRLEEVED